jgi:signal transduction histidine kinase
LSLLRPIASVALVLASAIPFPVEARERLHRRFDWRDGLPVGHVDSVAQDATGFLWIATPAGMSRFDGSSFDRIDRDDATIFPGSGEAGVFWRSIPDGAVWRALELGREAVAGPTGEPLSRVDAGAVAPDGALWILRSGELWRRAPAAPWERIDTPLPPLAALWPGEGGSVLAAMEDALVAIDERGAVEPIDRSGPPTAALVLADGRVAIGHADGSLHVVAAGRDPVVTAGVGRVLDVASRGGALWVARESGLSFSRGDGTGEALDEPRRLADAGRLLVDREGGIWCATRRGLVHFPEPETASWFAERGSFDTVEAARDRVLGTAADGAPAVLLVRRKSRWEPTPGPAASTGPSCLAEDGAAWTPVAGALVRWGADGPPRRHPVPGLTAAGRCAPGSGGARWIGTDAGLMLVAGERPRRLAPPPADGSGAVGGHAVLETSAGTLFASRAGSDRICRAPVAEVLEERARWSCDEVAGVERIADFLEMPSGDVWAATRRRGVLRLRGGRWEALGANDLLTTRMIASLEPAASGGAWVSGLGVVHRVIERPEQDDGWEVVETLGAWHGLPATNVADVAETADGPVWLASVAGMIEVPRTARLGPKAAPRVALASATVDGEPVSLDDRLDLPRSWSRISLRFAALSFRDADLLRYRLRLGPDLPWQPPTPDPLFRFSAVAPGSYDVEVEASLDGETWSSVPARVSFHVPRPWYRQPWLVALVLGAFAASIAVVARARLAVRLRLAEQRTRIARDLHDQLGSGLASIGLLARVLVRPDLPRSKRDDVASRIRAVSGELSTSLSDIVWSLKPGEANLDSLATHLVERAMALFPQEPPRLVVDLPSPVPRDRVSIAVRRNVLLIGLEALHNAARHADASRVEMSLAPRGRRWVLTIEDDGRGMPPAHGNTSTRGEGGVGTVGMRARASEIGADLVWQSRAGGGTIVCLAFSPFPGKRRRRRIA